MSVPLKLRVMIVDDDQSMARYLSSYLSKRYDVSVVGSGEEAIQIVRNSGSSVQLLITDIVMAGMPGTEAAQKILALVPNLKILYMSGYTEAAVSRDGMLAPGSAFLEKPFTPDALLSAVAGVFDES